MLRECSTYAISYLEAFQTTFSPRFSARSRLLFTISHSKLIIKRTEMTHIIFRVYFPTARKFKITAKTWKGSEV